MTARILRPVDDGCRYIVRDRANGVAEALALATALLDLCPDGCYPCRIEVEKSYSGSRDTSCTVTFQVAGRPKRW
jgi:hypothetical protein